MPRKKAAVNLTRAQKTHIKQVREKLAEKPPIDRIVTPEELADAIPAGEYQSLREWMVEFRTMRNKAGKSLADIAEETGIALETISRLESGNATNPTFKTLCLLAGAVGKRFTPGMG